MWDDGGKSRRLRVVSLSVSEGKEVSVIINGVRMIAEKWEDAIFMELPDSSPYVNSRCRLVPYRVLRDFIPIAQRPHNCFKDER